MKPIDKQKCPVCGHDREVFTSAEGTSGFVPPAEKLLFDEEKKIAEKIVDMVEITRFDDTAYYTVEDLKKEIAQALHDYGAKRERDKELEIQVNCVNDHASWKRIKEWLEDQKRKPAQTAFTSGPERWICQMIERGVRKG